MPQNDAAATDPIAGTGSFSRLLLSGIELEDTATLDHHHRHLNHHTTTVAAPNHFPYSTHQKSPKMLCFSSVALIPQNFTAGDTNNTNISPSPPLSTTSTATTSLSSNSNIKRNMGCDYHQPITGATASPAKTTGRNTKKMRAENTPPAGHAKVKKEKLGERIAALQQMVSPYGKTDTASVLHEALGYIKFLQEQVHVLCSPYLQQHLPPPENVQEGEWCEERKKDLRSRGLCLVPVECTLHVAESNGADMWSAAHGPLPL